jgi:Protein of unknown function (DUF3551)
MRPIAIALAASVAALAGMAPADARSGPRPWCMMEGGSAPLCLYYTFQQCYDTQKGLGGRCFENPALLWGRRDDQRRSRDRRDGRSSY